MRVLFYNWADYRDPEGRGGGVSVYQRNLIEGLANRAGIETAFLSAGLAYDLRPGGAPRIERLAEGESPRYVMVNSGLVAPSHVDFAGRAQIDHPATEQALARFIDRSGPWDIIHFNTLEGLPAAVLGLRARWPDTRFVLSMHNYYPFCPQVNLWHDERQRCPGFDAGARCVRCLPVLPDPRSIRTAYATGRALSRIGAGPGTAAYDRGFRPALGLAWRSLRRAVTLRRNLMARQVRHAPATDPDPGAARHFADRRATMLDLINRHCDAVLCVSERTRRIALEMGLRPDRLHRLYIGTREAKAWTRTAPRLDFLRPDRTLGLAYLGYMRRDKGFHFLIQALAALPPDHARRLHLTVAARSGDPEVMARMEALRPRLASLTHVDGYAHGDLDGILSRTDLGLVPVLWDDTLPQVAIEMHARHIPLLCADRGGARELGNCDTLVFRAGDTADFARVMGQVLDGTITPGDYWKQASPPVTMADHIDDLLALYRAIR